MKILSKLPPNYQSRIHPLFVAIPLTIWGLYRRFQFRATHDLWVDERYQAMICGKPFFQFLKNVPQVDFCKYLNGDYLLTYPFFHMFGYNKWGLAIPHIIITVLGFYVLYLICKQHFTTIWGYLITFSLFALNATLIRHSFAIRPYAVLAVLSLTSFYCATELMRSEGGLSPVKKLTMGLLFLFTIWFHPYGIVILFFASLYSLLAVPSTMDQLKRVLRDIIPFYAALLAVAMPLWLYSVVFSDPFDFGDSRQVFQFIPNPLIDPLGFSKGIICNLIGFKKLYFLFAGLIIAMVLPHKDRLKQMGFFLLLVIIPIQLILLLDMHNYYWFIQRQFIWVMPLFIFLLGWCWETNIAFIAGKWKEKGA